MKTIIIITSLYFFLNGFIAKDVYEKTDKYRFLKLIFNFFLGTPFLISLFLFYFLKVVYQEKLHPYLFYYDFYLTKKYKGENLQKYIKIEYDLIKWRDRSKSKFGKKQFSLVLKRINEYKND